MVQRDLALLLLLARTDMQRAVFEIDVLAVQRERLSGPQARAREQPDQRRMPRGAQRRVSSPAAAISASISSGE